MFLALNLLPSRAGREYVEREGWVGLDWVRREESEPEGDWEWDKEEVEGMRSPTLLPSRADWKYVEIERWLSWD